MDWLRWIRSRQLRARMWRLARDLREDVHAGTTRHMMLIARSEHEPLPTAGSTNGYGGGAQDLRGS